ncbi:MAG: tetratricopeptide repeat protein, partial [Bacteroidota bacterium]
MILKLILRAGLILLSCLLPFIGTAQTEIDSLLLRVEANCYDDLEQTLHFVELLEKKTTIKNNPSKWSKALLYKAVSAKYFGQMEKVLADLQQALDVAKQIQNDAVCRERMLEIQNEIGDYHLKMGNLDVAFLVFDQTIEKLRTRESLTKTEYQHLIISYLFAGKIKQQKKEYEAAITFYEYAIDYEKEKAAKNNRKASYGSTLGRLAQVYKEQGNYVLAIEHFKPCIKNYASIIKRDSAYFTYLASYVINNYHGLSECYLALNQPDSTLYYLNKSLAYPIPNKRYAALHNLLAGQAKVQQRQYHKADIYFQRAIDAIQHYYQDKKHAEVAAMYLSIGKSYQTAQKHKKALANYQLAIVNSVYNFDTLAVQANPKLRDIIAPQQLLASLHKKMDILYKEGKNTNDPTKLRLAWTTGTLATNLLDTITKESFFTEVDLMASISNQYSLFEIMIDIGYRLGLATWSESFALMEKSKSVALLKAFQKNKLPNLASSKKGTLDTMYQLKSAIAKEAALLYTTKNETSEDTLKILRIKNRLFEKQLAKRALQKRLLPLSYKGETTAHSLCVDSIKARLPNQQGLIEYFWGEQYLFAFIITPKHYALEKFSLTEDIKAYTKTLKEDLFYKRDAEYIR